MKNDIFDQLLIPIIVINPHNEIEYYNYICSTFFKLSPRKLSKYSRLEELLQTNDLSFNDLLQETRQNKSFVLSPEVQVITPNNDQLNCVFKLIFNNGHIVVNIIDFSIERTLHEKYKVQIKELQETHEQIVKADKLTALGEIIAGIGHEISTPLMIMNNRLENLENYLAIGDFQSSKNVVESLQQEYSRVKSILSGMKSLVKNEEDSVEIIDLEDVTDGVLEFISELNISQSITIEKSVLAPSLWILGNRVKLEQVLINLIKNSIDALVEAKIKEPKIILEIDHLDENLSQCIRVIDNGPGVPADKKDKIFEMFYTSKEASQGTGLGLAISKKIIESLSGSLSLKDSNRGCEFVIELPILEMSSFTHTNNYLNGSADTEGEKVLIVGGELKQLNEILSEFKDAEQVIIFSHFENDLEITSGFLNIDLIITLTATSQDYSELTEVKDISHLNPVDQMKFLEDLFESA